LMQEHHLVFPKAQLLLMTLIWTCVLGSALKEVSTTVSELFLGMLLL
jgi:hypothetical protein